MINIISTITKENKRSKICKRQVVFHKLRHLIFQKMRQTIFHSLRHFIFHTDSYYNYQHLWAPPTNTGSILD